MTMKTPEQIADEAMQAFTIADGDVDERSAAYIRDTIRRAVEADRAQPRYLLISEHDDAGVIGLYHSRQDAIDAATANCDNDPDVWDDYYSIQEV